MGNHSLSSKARLIPTFHATRTLSLGLILALTYLLLAIPTPLAHSAGTINVTTTADEYDVVANGSCSLREAIQSINTDTSFGGCSNPGGADTIQLQTTTYQVSIPYVASQSNSEGSLMPETSMTIQGQGAGQTIVDASAGLNDHVFDIETYGQPIVFTMMGLTIQNGPKQGVSAFVSGSGAVGSELTFTNLLVQNNARTGMYLSVPADDVQITIHDAIIRNNNPGSTSDYGGGLCVTEGGQVELSSATIYNNKSKYGAGIYYRAQYSGDYLKATNVTIYGNTASVSGGGLYMAYSSQGATLTNVTFEQNLVMTGDGGSIYAEWSPIRLVNTIVANGKKSGGTLLNNCAGNPLSDISSLGHNLASDGTCNLTSSGDQDHQDPMFDGILANHGGHTPTMALMHNSPAVDAGDDSACPAVDQRGVSRPQGPRCDIGAYEFEPPTADDIVVTGQMNTDIEITLQGHDPQSDPLSYWIDSLPTKGTLYQYDNGNRGAEITAALNLLWDPGHRVFLVPAPDGTGLPYATFEYYVHDGTSRSASATVNVDVLGGWVFLPILMKTD